MVTLFYCFVVFTSCEEDSQEDFYGKIELQTESSYQASYLPEDYNMDEWNQYYQEHGEFPQTEGQPLSYTIVVLVSDKDGNPLQGEEVNFLADGGSLSASRVISNASGMAEVTWAFDGTWGTWGNFYLTISVLEDDGTDLKNSPIQVESIIEAPPGV